MRKFLAIVLTVMLVTSLSLTAYAAQPEISVPKATTAPVIDGVVNEGEYKLIASYAGNDTAPWGSLGANAKSRKVDFYATWDSTNFYVAVIADCAPAHVQVYEGENYIFNAHHLMSAAIPTTPKDPKYVPADGVAWEWGAASSSNLGREWSIAIKSTDNTLIAANHFGPAVEFPYTVKSANGKDVYEQAIPWTFIDPNGENKFDIGAVFGFAFVAGVGDASTDMANGVDPDGDYVEFAKGINSYKNFADYAVVTLADVEAPAAAETTEEAADENPDTSDVNSVIFLLAAAVSVIAFTLIKKVCKA
jgi:hypothetical protein